MSLNVKLSTITRDNLVNDYLSHFLFIDCYVLSHRCEFLIPMLLKP